MWATIYQPVFSGHATNPETDLCVILLVHLHITAYADSGAEGGEDRSASPK